MSEQRAYTNGFTPQATRAMTEASMSAWMQITQQIVDHTFRSIGDQMELGRRMAGSRSIGEFLDAQTELSQRTVQTALECGRRITEAGQNMARGMTDCIAETVNVAAETTAQQARVTEEQFRATSDQTRNALKAAAREADEAVARAAKAQGGPSGNGPEAGKTDPARKASGAPR